MLGVVVTIVMFALIAPKSRVFLFGRLEALTELIAAFAPFSYVLLILVIAAPVVSWGMVTKGPKLKEPEDPMRKYRHADDVVPD